MSDVNAEWARVKEWFHAALELPEADREAFVRQGLHERDDLIREVRTLLDAHVEGEHQERFERS